MSVVKLFAASAALLIAAPAMAQSGWTVRAQAHGGNPYSGFSDCGSSDGQVNCDQINGVAAGSVTYSNGDATIEASGSWSKADNPGALGNPAAVASSYAIADLTHASIRQMNSNNFATGTTAGTLIDTLTFKLPDPGTVYSLPFSYSFDGQLSGGMVGDSHPGLYATSNFALGNGYIASTQNIAYGGPAYNAPAISYDYGNQWTIYLTPTDWGYTISGEIQIGGEFGNTLGFNMQSSLFCGNSVGRANCDYSHTQIFDFSAMPKGVSYGSASGRFLTAAAVMPGVPEPAIWLMMIVGFGLVGATMRRRCRPVAAWARYPRLAADDLDCVDEIALAVRGGIAVLPPPAHQRRA